MMGVRSGVWDGDGWGVWRFLEGLSSVRGVCGLEEAVYPTYCIIGDTG